MTHFARNGNVASGPSGSSTIRSLAKGYSRSRTTRGLEECALLGAPTRSHCVGFPQCPVPANQVSPVAVAGHGEMSDTLKVPQDFMWAVRQHQHVFVVDAALELVMFSSRIHCCSDEELTYFICSPHLHHFVRAFWPHTTTGITGFPFVCTGITGV